MIRGFRASAALGILFLLPAFMGCSSSGTRVETAEDVDVGSYRRLAVLPFTDPRGQGRAIADAVKAGLPQIMYENADAAAVAKILARVKSDPGEGPSLEALELIRGQTSAEAIMTGRMAPDWSAAMVNIVETEMGRPILSAVIKPRPKEHKVFANAAEVSREVLRMLSARH